MEGRASNRRIIVVSNSLGDKIVDTTSRADQRAVVFDQGSNQYIHVEMISLEDITFETLLNNGNVGYGANQLAPGNHDHDVGNLALLFENRIL